MPERKRASCCAPFIIARKGYNNTCVCVYVVGDILFYCIFLYLLIFFAVTETYKRIIESKLP